MPAGAKDPAGIVFFKNKKHCDDRAPSRHLFENSS